MKYLLNTAVLVLMLATPATAAEIIFYTGQSGYTGAFSGAGSVYNQTKSGTINCPTGGCVNDNIQNTLSFAAQPSGQSTIAVTATAFVQLGQFEIPLNVWGDFSPNFGGLGVGNSGSDQIDGPEVLHIHFANTVTVTGLATLFAPAHADDGKFGNVAIGDIDGSDTFLFSQNGTTFNSVTFGNANTFHGVNVSGQDFYFKEDGSTQPQFYVSALTYVTGTVGTQCTNGCAVPGPIVGAGLPGLAMAFGGLGVWWRRRRAYVLTQSLTISDCYRGRLSWRPRHFRSVLGAIARHHANRLAGGTRIRHSAFLKSWPTLRLAVQPVRLRGAIAAVRVD